MLFDHQIFSSQPQGGVSRYFTELLKGLAASGDEAVTAWSYTANRYLQDWNPSRYRDWWPSFPFKGKAHLTGWLNRRVSRQELAGTSWDVLHPTYFDPYFLPLLRGRPFVLTLHDMTHERYPEGLSDRRVLPGRKRLLAERATRVIAVSENTRHDAIELLGLDPEKVVAIPHGNSLRPGVVEPAPTGHKGPYWLYVGARAAYKNWALVVEALARRADPSDSLVMVGGGPLDPEERQLLRRAGLEGRFLQTSASDSQLAGWYRGATALVYPSLYEGFGMPLVEAMAWGCPVAAARASCLPEIAGHAAVYFDPASADDLVRALAQLTDSATRSRLSLAGQTRADQFTWQRTVDQTRRVYQECL